MRPARRADPPHRPDHSKKPRSPLQSPSPDRLPDPSAGAQSFTHSDTDISLPPIASYPTPQLGSKMTTARTAVCNVIIPYIESHYPVIADADHRGIYGYSLGGGATFNEAFGYSSGLDTFHRSEEHTSELQSPMYL